MNEQIFPWRHKRRYNSYSEYFKQSFGERVQKVAIDAGFTCPNRDGTKGMGGCTYCNNDSFNPSYCQPNKSITLQIKEGIEFHSRRYRRAKDFLAYFQPYSNTYAPLEKLKSIYDEALRFPGIMGLVIGTRPDCVNDEILDYIAEVSRSYYVILELGLESCYDKTLRRINRGHTWAESEDAIRRAASRGIKVGAHIIFGLPGESREEMLKEADIISALPLTNIKFHQLQIIKKTRMAAEYLDNPESFNLFTMEDYLSFMVRFLEKLNPSIVVERFAGEVPPRFLVSAPWSNLRNDAFNRLLEKKLEDYDTWQGRLFHNQINP
ncbi:MAG: TIGR01212 family radical SAM protein [Bacteroidota bacterium]|nr:TIGR01212 family radical SAM protein [Bacteroidota bacterium]